MRDFKVSVIIPVYNAEKYLAECVESAIHLAEVGEIVLIEDNSPDRALDICKMLQSKYAKVSLYQHPRAENMGAGASRNLGIQKSKHDFIAFLDADDWYLSNRFIKEKELFDDETVDGVYGATGFFYQDTQKLDPDRLTTLKRDVKPNQLLFTLLHAETGRFTTDAITIRKSILSKSGLFDTSLKLHQDTHLWLRLAHVGRLVPGSIDKAVSIRRVHSHNRIAKKNDQSRQLLFKKVFESFLRYDDVSKKDFRVILKKYIATLSRQRIGQLMYATRLVIKNPELIRKLL
jgi:glycosyltransferase involved in cell wall biosynthesis